MLTRTWAMLFVIASILVPACQASPRPFRCTDSIGCVDIAPGEPIKLGVLQTLSGGSLPAGVEQTRSIQLAVAKRGNQLLQHPIKLQIEDERCTSEGGANAALRIVADPQAVAILGTNCSSAAVTAGKIMSKAGLVMISSSNTSPVLTSAGGMQGVNWSPGYLRTAWNDAVMGRAAATFAVQKLGVRQAAVVNADDAYTKGLTDAFAQVFKELGGQLVLETAIDEDEANQRPMLNAVALSGAQLLFFPLSHPETGSRIVRQAKEVKELQKLVFIGGEGMLSEVFIREAGAAGVGVYILGPTIQTSPANDAVREEYTATFGEPPSSFYYSFAFDAVNLLLGAIEQVARREPNGTLHIGRQALRDALYTTYDFDGLTGRLTCDKFGDCGVANLNIVRLEAQNVSIQELRSNIVYTFTFNP